jgi:uroporphyrinogen decarboxylase
VNHGFVSCRKSEHHTSNPNNALTFWRFSPIFTLIKLEFHYKGFSILRYAMSIHFKGLQVMTFASRRAGEMKELIIQAGGNVLEAPSMREIPLDRNTEALEFADLLFARWIDAVIVTTGTGVRLLIQAVATKHDTSKFLEALKGIQIVALGPKPIAALKEYGLSPTVVVPEPYTWNDLLDTLDKEYGVGKKRIAVVEYGQSNPELIEALEQRGAQVRRLPLYRWDLPEDLDPLHRAVRQIAFGEPAPVDIGLFTSATQVRNLFKVAEMDRIKEQVREGFKKICIGSVGPIASRAIVEQGLVVDYEPDRTNMIHLVREMARRGHDLLRKKRAAVENSVDTNAWKRIDMVWKPSDQAVSTTRDSVFVKACRREKTPYTPVWIMRQAGRYQREYLKVRKQVSMLELCKTPELAAEVTLMAVDRLGVDAAIIFADILLVTEPMGLRLEFVKGAGPVIYNPVRTGADVEALLRPDPKEFGYVYDALKITRRALRPDIGLIGFSGAPFTIASYMIEGGKSSDYARTKTMMYCEPEIWHGLMKRLTDVLIDYLNGQIAAGADVVQIFDSWAGSLSPDDYRQSVLPHMKTLIGGIDKSAPVINFSTGNPMLLPLMKEAGGQVIGLDWRCDLAQAWAMLGNDVAVMGNMDPIVLYTTPKEIRAHVKAILDKAAGRPGHIFNLGHGVSPDMPPENVAEVVDAVHELSRSI